MRTYLHIFLILAFVLSGISPACAFISGKTSIDIEICTTDGIKIIKMQGEEQPEKDPSHNFKKKDCAFCFTQTHLKAGKAHITYQVFTPRFFSGDLFLSNPALVKRAELASLSARAPPFQS